MNENNIVINNSNTVNIPRQSHGAGTALMLIFFWWFFIGFWWPMLLIAWLVWLLIAGITTIFKRGFFTATWYYPWPAWMLGIR
jgi:hypothetical protein